MLAKKFEDPSLLANEYNKILDITVSREKCKKKNKKSKARIREIRDRYGDLHIT